MFILIIKYYHSIYGYSQCLIININVDTCLVLLHNQQWLAYIPLNWTLPLCVWGVVCLCACVHRHTRWESTVRTSFSVCHHRCSKRHLIPAGPSSQSPLEPSAAMTPSAASGCEALCHFGSCTCWNITATYQTLANFYPTPQFLLPVSLLPFSGEVPSLELSWQPWSYWGILHHYGGDHWSCKDLSKSETKIMLPSQKTTDVKCSAYTTWQHLSSITFFCKLDWELVNYSKKAKKRHYKNSGVVTLENVQVTCQ